MLDLCVIAGRGERIVSAFTRSNPFARALFRAVQVCWFLVGSAVAALATTVVPPEFEQLVNDCDYVVQARVRSILAEKQTEGGRTTIVTHVALDVVEVVAGHPPPQIILELLGGRVGDEELTVEGMPRFRVGEEDILFVSGNGRSVCPLYGMMYGRYLVAREPVTGGEYITRGDGVPLADTRQIATPMQQGAPHASARQVSPGAGLAPEEFIRRIRAAVKPSARLKRAK